MKRLLVLLLVLITACKNEVSDSQIAESKNVIKTSEEVVVDDFELDVYDYDGLEPLINKDDDKIHVVNFWATWCAPCVKELPYFEDINQNYKDKDVEVLLVSLDFPNKYETSLKPFIKKYDIKSKVVAFDDTDQNRWIPAINENWSGALPATIIYKGDKRQFYEQSFTQEELETELKQFLKT
jgi:thiol-disulfide isomerase/thioredoxin